MKKTGWLLCAALIVGPAHGRQSPPPKLDALLEAVTGAAHKIIETDPRDSFKNFDSLIVLHQGRTAFEKYYNGVQGGAPHQMQSQTKSITALLLGVAIDQGLIKSENEKVAPYFPESFAPGDKLKAAMTIKDLLTMSAGIDWEEMLPQEDPKNDNAKMFRSDDWLAYVLARPMAVPPGTVFEYNSGCPMLVAAIIEKASGQSLEAFARKTLFEPLDIREFTWLKNAKGFCHAGGGLALKPMDMAKIGELALNKGMWKGRRIVSEGWIERAVTPRFMTEFNASGYGYFWWTKDYDLGEGRKTRVISSRGAGGQFTHILPDYGLVLAFTERNFTTPQVGGMIVEDLIEKLKSLPASK
ncbi:MAG: serine hydrolase [Candidatus Aminicenantes bacterium]|nr:serine hydrolase [Candidatus Aminicenantes bacterium]